MRKSLTLKKESRILILMPCDESCLALVTRGLTRIERVFWGSNCREVFESFLLSSVAGETKYVLLAGEVGVGELSECGLISLSFLSAEDIARNFGRRAFEAVISFTQSLCMEFENAHREALKRYLGDSL